MSFFSILTMATYSFDGKFTGNILVVGRTGCGKTTFIQKLGTNKLCGNEITDVFWVSSEREGCIRDSFVDQKVHLSARSTAIRTI